MSIECLQNYEISNQINRINKIVKKNSRKELNFYFLILNKNFFNTNNWIHDEFVICPYINDDNFFISNFFNSCCF